MHKDHAQHHEPAHADTHAVASLLSADLIIQTKPYRKIDR
jgi:hypothetical protein